MIFGIREASKVSLSLVVVASLLSACSKPTQPTSTTSNQLPAITNEIVEIDGSSTVYPITEAVVNEFKQTQPDIQVQSAFSGTGGGFEKFCAGQTDINGASRPISTQEIETCRNAGVRYIELPIAFDALTIVVHPQNSWAQDITVEELKKLWEPAAQGQIKTWNQVRPDWSNQPINLYGAGTDSGTYDYFAEVIVESENTRSDYTGSEDDTVLVQGIANDPNALGYFGLSYYEQNQDKLKALPVNGGNGAILPSRETVESAMYQPLSRPLFIYVNIQSAQQYPELKEFVDFYLKHGARISESVGYVPLPAEAYEIGQVHLYKGEVGTAYDGKPQPNLTIREVLQKEQTL
ncbi:MAG: PstS family phosphate ABC transporter substrate-binding protein [Cyanobacteria bacterium RU_5_0]|nr:PstS family phosphate ABC transporter substrate-binding protein [Cyanobacteria bacterium RU_5_0]